MAKPKKSADFPHAEVGRRIRQARKQVEPALSQAEMGRRVGISTATAFRYETGESMPPGDTMALLAELLGVSAYWLVTGEDPPSAKQARVVYDSEVDPALLEKVIREAGLNARQAEDMRRGYWTKGTTEFTLGSYARDLKNEETGKVTDRTVPDVSRGEVIIDVVGDIEKRGR